jgi:hypothetical protein
LNFGIIWWRIGRFKQIETFREIYCRWSCTVQY